MVDEAQVDKRLKRLERRRSAAPLELGAPGPDAALLRRLLAIALRVPDHGKLEPWRLIVLEGAAKREASERLARLYVSENPEEDDDRRDKQAEKIAGTFAAAPVTIVVVSRADPQARKPEWEQILSAGAVCMNLLTAATLAGFDGVWLTGWPAYNEAAKGVLGIATDERVAGFIHIGTGSEKQKDRPRPDLDEAVTWWQAS
ncbi:nitroreductase [Pseudochelatococcus lubricantis]|uniref:Putative NAD(P)H nitroreductase n=1 Tax=Pseudochelatococcus lubricantis TaxID=1538102 RepID=A0ABX0V2R2_9HYPH|nr:nitroreductase [Pseudochelatococcus lubricantis]NIJ59509.1 nitroreductase [Pseudochelatococcus lubricantis]